MARSTAALMHTERQEGEEMGHDEGHILVVGGAGYIGSHVVARLLEQDRKVVICDNFSTGFRELVPGGAILEEGDLCDKAYLHRLFRDYRFEAVMHLAAWACVPESVTEPLRYYVNNVANTITLLQAMIANECTNFIFSSSAAVFGEPSRTPLMEDDSRVPTNPYGRTKLMLEQLLADLSLVGQVRYVSLRYFNAAGADPLLRVGEMHDPETHLIPLVLEAAAGERESVSVCGTDYPTQDGTCVRDFIHVSDIAEAHILALRHLLAGNDSDVFNLGNGTGYSVREVIETVRRVTGRDIVVREVPRRPGDPAILVASSDKIGRVLGWVPVFSSLESIVETAWRWKQRLCKG